MITKAMLREQIIKMGIRPNDTVLIHTSMRKIGDVEDGANGVIDAFCEYLSEGLFLVPTHTWATIGKSQPVFDVRYEKPCIGALPCAAAFRSDGVRSLHPMHSIWAKGKNAAEFIKGEENAETPAPPGFAWSRLADVNAKILLIGVGNDKNTFIHAVDELADIPDRLEPNPFVVTIIDSNGNEYKHPFRNHSCTRSDDVSAHFPIFDKPFNELGVQTFGTLGNATVRIIDAKRCRDVVLKIYSRADRDVCLDYDELPEDLYR